MQKQTRFLPNNNTSEFYNPGGGSCDTWAARKMMPHKNAQVAAIANVFTFSSSRLLK